LANSNITLDPDLHGEPLIGTDSLTPNFSEWILADVIVKRESLWAVETTPDVRAKTFSSSGEIPLTAKACAASTLRFATPISFDA